MRILAIIGALGSPLPLGFIAGTRPGDPTALSQPLRVGQAIGVRDPADWEAQPVLALAATLGGQLDRLAALGREDLILGLNPQSPAGFAVFEQLENAAGGSTLRFGQVLRALFGGEGF